MSTTAGAAAVDRQIEQLRQDDVFMTYVETPLIQEAVEHWLNIRRLPAEVAEERFGSNHMVQSVFDKIKNLQQTCVQERVPFPLELIHVASRRHPMSPTAAVAMTPPPPSKPAGVLRQSSTLTRRRSSAGGIRFDQANLVREFTIKGGNDPHMSRRRRLWRGGAASSVFSVTDPKNIARWWAVQCFVIGLSFAAYMLY